MRQPTIASTWQTASGEPITDDLLAWPPDVFALTEVILGRTESYRFLLCPPGCALWPPARFSDWPHDVEEVGRKWASWAESRRGALPALLTEEWRSLAESVDRPLEQLADGQDERLREALLTLHAIADEACAGLGIPLGPTHGGSCSFRARGRELLTRTGSLARIHPQFLRVLPKVRTSPNATALGSFSRYACIHGPGTEARWYKVPVRHRGTEPTADAVTLLLLPWPLRVRECDFRPLPLKRPAQRLRRRPIGGFEFVPHEELDLDLVVRTIAAARDEVGSVDVVVMPESAVAEEDLEALEAVLDREGVATLIAGVRQRWTGSGRLPGNWVHIGVNPRLEKGAPPLGSPRERWIHIRQNKHHPWSLDEAQVEQYHIGGTLHPRIRWEEAVDVPRRALQVCELGEDIAIIALVCEDLAQIDDLAEMIRAIGPTVVMTPLLDGPQLSSRWTARYASVLADDPGSAVLTLTSFGMVQRCRPHGREASRVIALSKDPGRGAREISLEPGAQAVVLTTCGDRATRGCADGRLPVDNMVDWYDVAVYQVKVPTAASSAGSDSARLLPPEPPPLNAEEVSVITGWAQSLAESLADAPERAPELLANARPGAPWRGELGLSEPSPRLVEALDCLIRLIEAPASRGGTPTGPEVLASIEEGAPEPGLNGLVCRLLRSTLEQVLYRRVV